MLLQTALNFWKRNSFRGSLHINTRETCNRYKIWRFPHDSHSCHNCGKSGHSIKMCRVMIADGLAARDRKSCSSHPSRTSGNAWVFPEHRKLVKILFRNWINAASLDHAAINYPNTQHDHNQSFLPSVNLVTLDLQLTLDRINDSKLEV